MTRPLPIRNGVSPSYIWLQKGPWTTLLEFLTQRFPHLEKVVWESRMRRGEVVDQTGNKLSIDAPYRGGQQIFYYREIESELAIPFEEQVLFQDQHILVVDKPHFLPVTPTGRFLQETLLIRLKRKHALPHLSPIHRLDRETAGVMIFSLSPTSRGAYQVLFQKRAVQKEYQAIAAHSTNIRLPIVHRSCIITGTPFFRMREVAGKPNSETKIECIEQMGAWCRYRLVPVTGRKHQLRVHLAALGIPILNDAFYPLVQACGPDDWSKPLQLLSKSIAFVDPISGQQRFFESQRELNLSPSEIETQSHSV